MHVLVVEPFHAAPLTASHALRHKQVHVAHVELVGRGGGDTTAIVGDFNYPLFSRALTARLKDSGYDLSLSVSTHLHPVQGIQENFDVVTSLRLDISDVDILPRGKVNHMPILITAGYRYLPAVLTSTDKTLTSPE